MGQQQLRDIAVLEETQLEEIQGEVVAVDAYNWLYKYISTYVRIFDEDLYTTRGDGREYPNLVGALRGLPLFLEHDLKPIFVFDGVAHDLKAEEQQKRRELREEIEERAEEAQAGGDMERARRLKAQSQTISEEMAATTMDMFDRMGVPFVVAPGAGEAQVAYMAREDPDVSYAVSEDYDSLLFGAPRTIRNFTGDGSPEVMHFNRTLDTHELTWEQLVDVGLLLGTDYNEGASYVGPSRGVKWIQQHGDVHTVMEEKGKEVEDVDAIRTLFLESTASNEYHVPGQVVPDLGAAEEYVVEEVGLPESPVRKQLDRIHGALD